MKQVELSFTGLGKLLKSDTKVWFCQIPVDLWLFGLGSLNLCALKTQTGLSHLFRRDIDQSRCVLSLACKYKGWTAVERGFWWLFNIRTSGWCDMRPGRPKLGLTLGKQQVYYRKLRDDARKSRGSSFRFLTLTILLISGFALLLCSLAWEHIKTLLPAFARRFRYKKGWLEFFDLIDTEAGDDRKKNPLQLNFHWGGALPCFVAALELHF